VQICSNTLPTVVADVTQVPWGGTAPIGVTYTPNGMAISTTPVNNILNPTYYKAPTFYISDMGASADPSIPGEIYQVDAVGYGGNSNTAAVVESTYAVYTSSACRGCP
jgi:Tfp pilus assembly protein PilX